jgi:hypothetical protein
LVFGERLLLTQSGRSMFLLKPPITVGLREIMKKIDLGQTIETLANVGVIAGIIFLVVELRQGNELMEADARFNRLTRSADAWQSIAENGDLTELQVRSENGEVLSEVEQRRVDAAAMRFLMNLEWHYGEFPPDSPERNYLEQIIKVNADKPSFKRVWSSRKAYFDSGFVDWVDSLVLSE